MSSANWRGSRRRILKGSSGYSGRRKAVPLPEKLRTLPYKVHTNSELGLMLDGIKPLAIFTEAYGNFPECLVRYLRCFDRCANEGRLSRWEFVKPMRLARRPDFRGIHYIYYTLPGEEWRAEAMLELLDRKGSWNAEREREFGTLLGYTDWQNDIWAERFPYRSLES
jgi:hypothetical protein